MHWQILYWLLPIKWVITNDQRFMGLLSISHVFKNLHFPILLHSFLSVQFLEQLPSSFPFATFVFFSKSPTCFHKSYLQSKTFLNVWAVPSSAVFCSNAVLTTAPSSSMHFFSFFDVLPSTPTTTGMTLMLLMFQILSISLFGSCISRFFRSYFTNPYVSRYTNINYGTTSLQQYLVFLPWSLCHIES